ncbi:hypothetical protein MYX07_05480 [Patescibacteria group bacterium AH-259-L07]|nr:hypothetical protein [Patescibacteria group bacterium AH-259-L07]
MSSIHQWQRYTLEELKPDKQNSLTVSRSENNTYYLDEERIFLSGISPGVGTCSNLHGIYIAVFESNPPDRLQFPRGIETVTCDWSSLVRGSTEEEKQVWFQEHGNICCLTAQSIELIKKEKNSNGTTFYFTLGKKRKTYSHTI